MDFYFNWFLQNIYSRFTSTYKECFICILKRLFRTFYKKGELALLTHNHTHNELLTISEASSWATLQVGRNVTQSNISYLIQYGLVRKYSKNGTAAVLITELENYYNSYDGFREKKYKDQLGDDINWLLSFSQIKEAESTKHVHRLHPYKGKFIPQLVEYFIDTHVDKFKQNTFFNQNDIILDPFSGSGTTMVQANECGINSIGIDISPFNVLIANCKVAQYDFADLKNEIERVTDELCKFVAQSNIIEFEKELLYELNIFNSEFFPVPDYKYHLRQGEIDETVYGQEKEQKFFPIYNDLVRKYNIELRQKSENTFLGKWFSKQIRKEIDFAFELIKKVRNPQTQKILTVILSRTMRSCRSTTHSDLATLVDPVTATYYCSKHGKMCKPVFSVLKWWKTYTKDTFSRLKEFDALRTNTTQCCIVGDSRNIDIIATVSKENSKFSKMVAKRKINGIFSSPPYVGMIDYHEQHAYAYDLFKFKRNDDSEIGPLFRGKGKQARESYVDGISRVLVNCKRFLVDNYDVFLVSNDKYNLYPIIASKSGMKIVNTFKRPVLNRSEKDKTAYSETIFHLQEDK